MPRLTLSFGIALIALGAGFYAVLLAFSDDKVSPTALIPAAFGVLLAICGGVVMLRPDVKILRMIFMHLAPLVALLGAVGGVMRLPKSFSEGGNAVAGTQQALMAVICLAYVILAVKSFIDARRASSPS